MANAKVALALGGAALGGLLLWALSGDDEEKQQAENGTIPVEDLPLEPFELNPGEFYSDIPNDNLLEFYQDMLEFPQDYNDQAIVDMINTLAFRGFEDRAQTLAGSLGVA